VCRLVILRKSIVGLSEPTLERFLSKAKRAVRIRAAVNVLVTTNAELRRLNRRFRGKDKPTDVLSFPPALGLQGGLAGDVAISAGIATQNARRLGHSAAQEIKILVLHGLLHLAGHDHERDQGQMARKEQLLRQQLGLPVGLIERIAESEVRGNRLIGTAARQKRGTRSQRKSGAAGILSSQVVPSYARPGRARAPVPTRPVATRARRNR
jgi:probable rRNA maturation factor